MKPQPRQLALWMSIAGLGSSLVGAVDAHTVGSTAPQALAVEEGWLVHEAPAADNAQWVHGMDRHPPARVPLHTLDRLRIRTPNGPRSTEGSIDLMLELDTPPEPSEAPDPIEASDRCDTVDIDIESLNAGQGPHVAEIDFDLSTSFDIDLGIAPVVFKAVLPVLTPIAANHAATSTTAVDFELLLPETAAPSDDSAALDIDLSGPPSAPPDGSAGATPPPVVVATQVDRVLRNLEALVDTRGPLRPLDRWDASGDAVFVATQEEKVLKTLELLLKQPAQTTPPARTTLLGNQVALGDARLADIRGGFQPPGGVMLSFGIERAIYINGSLVASTSLVDAAGAGSVGGTPSITAGASPSTLIQNGAGNAYVSGPMSSANVGTVIQNSLNDQRIAHVTSISATVNSLQLTRAQNFESALRGALVDSLRR